MQQENAYTHVAQFINDAPKFASFQQILMTHNWDVNDLVNLERPSIAALGETTISDWTKKAGWTEVGQRIRGRRYELDLVIHRGCEHRVIEVKTRLFPRHVPDFSILQGWLSSAKRSAMTRGVKDLVARGHIPTNSSISVELISVDILKDDLLRVCRWPDIFPLLEISSRQTNRLWSESVCLKQNTGLSHQD
jgi:hypothetical protein